VLFALSAAVVGIAGAVTVSGRDNVSPPLQVSCTPSGPSVGGVPCDGRLALDFFAGWPLGRFSTRKLGNWSGQSPACPECFPVWGNNTCTMQGLKPTRPAIQRYGT